MGYDNTMNKENNTILIIGGTGKIGNSFVESFLKQKFIVNVLARNISNFSNQENLHYFNFKNISDAFKNVKYVISVFGSLKPFDTNIKNYLEEYENMKLIIEKSEQANIEKFILISSSGSIYGDVAHCVNESEIVAPKSFYGYQKYILENMIVASQMSYMILRVSNPYGFDVLSDYSHGLIDVAINKIINNKEIAIFGDGSNIKDYIYIDDLLCAVEKAMFSNVKNETLNIGFGKSFSINEILELIEKITNKQFKKRNIESHNVDIKEIYLDISKAEKLIEWKPIISSNQGIKLLYKRIIKGK